MCATWPYFIQNQPHHAKAKILQWAQGETEFDVAWSSAVLILSMIFNTVYIAIMQQRMWAVLCSHQQKCVQKFVPV